MGVTAMPPDVVASATAAGKAYLRLVGDDELGVLAGCARAALALAEAFCGQVLVRRVVEDVVGTGGAWQALSAAPVASIAGLTGLPVAGAPFVLAVDGYAVDIDAQGVGWVRVLRSAGVARVAVNYAAGLAADWSGLPEPIAQGVAMLTAHLFEKRVETSAPPAAVAALWRPYRRIRFAMEQRT